MKNVFTFNTGLNHSTECAAAVNSINKLIKHKPFMIDNIILHSELSALLKDFDYAVVIDNTHGIETDDGDIEIVLSDNTTISIYCGIIVYSYKYNKNGDKDNKPGFIYGGGTLIDTSLHADSLHDVAEEKKAEVRTAKEPVAEEASKSTNEPEFVKAMKNSNPKQNDADMVKRILKAREYFEINKIFTDDFNIFVNDSIVPLTAHLKNIRDRISKEAISQSGNSLLGNLSVEEIDEYIKPFSYLITLIDIEDTEKAAYMIKSAFNAMLLAHMDAKLNGYDEDLHIEYNENTK